MYPDISLHIDGGWTKGSGGKTIPVLNPATGESIGNIAHAETADLERAARAAGKGFQAWRKVSAFERYKLMRKAAENLRSRADELARLMTMEQGKPVGEAKMETLAGADLIDWFAEEGRRAYGRVIPARAEGFYQLAVKEPVGPVAAFTPWNFPINQAVRKISCAVAAGCSIVIKGPEDTPGSVAELVRAFVDAGLPAGVINLVYGVPSEISEYLVPHPVIRKISFTGSSAVGKHLAALAGKHMKRVTMELGGHAPGIVFEDADVDQAAGPGAALREIRRQVHGRRQGRQGRRRARFFDPDGTAGEQPARRCDGDVRGRRHAKRRQAADRRQADRQQGLLLRADRADRRAAGRQDHERGTVRPRCHDRAVPRFRGGGVGGQSPQLRLGGLCVHQIGQDRGRGRCRGGNRDDRHQQRRAGAAGSAVPRRP